MQKKHKSFKKRVFFNASVILAGLRSSTGASGSLLKYAKEKKLEGLISEIVLNEVLRHSEKLALDRKKVPKKIFQTFPRILSAPKKLDLKYKKIVLDIGDIHLFTSAKNVKADYLISLDKKHVLSLKNKVKDFKIASPGEFLKEIKGNS